MKKFEYAQPQSEREAVELLADAQARNGGTRWRNRPCRSDETDGRDTRPCCEYSRNRFAPADRTGRRWKCLGRSCGLPGRVLG